MSYNYNLMVNDWSCMASIYVCEAIIYSSELPLWYCQCDGYVHGHPTPNIEQKINGR